MDGGRRRGIGVCVVNGRWGGGEGENNTMLNNIIYCSLLLISPFEYTPSPALVPKFLHR